MAYKKCMQCGVVKPEKQFKIKYSLADGTPQRSKFCRQCEADTKLFNDLSAAGQLTEQQQGILSKFRTIFLLLERQGLSTPMSRSRKAPQQSVSARLEELGDIVGMSTESQVAAKPMSTPLVEASADITPDAAAQLNAWLVEDFSVWYAKNYEPDYLASVIYPTLKATYRPEVGWDDEAMLPLYDDTCKQQLDTISDRFWDYEDWYHAQKAQKESTDEG